MLKGHRHRPWTTVFSSAPKPYMALNCGYQRCSRVLENAKAFIPNANASWELRRGIEKCDFYLNWNRVLVSETLKWFEEEEDGKHFCESFLNTLPLLLCAISNLSDFNWDSLHCNFVPTLSSQHIIHWIN